jgi:diaminopimelate decarboxylase
MMISLVRRAIKPLILRYVHSLNERRRKELLATQQSLKPEDWGLQSIGGDLHWGGCRLADLAQRYGTPLHVVNAERLMANYHQFRDAFAAEHPNSLVGFSYKTNPLPGALTILHAAGAIAEVISHYELWLALRLGVPPDRIVLNGPGKSAECMRLAVELGVHLINLDNILEADILQEAARQMGRKQRVGVRVVTSVGWAAQFGIPVAGGAALSAFERLQQCPDLLPCGLHIHLGTGIKDVSVYLQAVRELLAFARELKAKRGILIHFFDLGGGFGVPTVAPLTEMDERLLTAGYPAAPVDPRRTPTISTYAQAIGQLLREWYPEAERPTLFFEPGRAISSSAQLLLLRVRAMKPGPAGSLQVILDGGHNLAIPTSYEHHALWPVCGMNRPFDRVHHFYGPLCHPGDVLARQVLFPTLQVGDVVAMMDAGAYFIPNQMNFSNPRPPAVVVEQGRDRLTREAETFEHMIQLDQVERA